MQDIDELKKQIYKIAAVTDRGQRLNKLIAPLYQEKSKEMKDLIKDLEELNLEVSEEKLSGELEFIITEHKCFLFDFKITNRLESKFFNLIFSL